MLKSFLTLCCFGFFHQDIAQLIIERPTIMTPVLEEGPAGEETYQALLRLYTIALQQAIDMQEGNFSWVRNIEKEKAKFVVASILKSYGSAMH